MYRNQEFPEITLEFDSIVILNKCIFSSTGKKILIFFPFSNLRFIPANENIGITGPKAGRITPV